MALSVQHPLWRSFALRVTQTQWDAIQELDGTTDTVEVDGLLDLIQLAPSAGLVVGAIRALKNSFRPAVLHMLLEQLQSDWSSVRLASILAVQDRLEHSEIAGLIPVIWSELTRLVVEENSWNTRRHALQTAFEVWMQVPSFDLQSLNFAATDPHWRVRHAYVEAVSACDGLVQKLVQSGLQFPRPLTDHEQIRATRIRSYLEWLSQDQPIPFKLEANTGNASVWSASLMTHSVWDWDPVVLARNLDQLPSSSMDTLLPLLPQLARHPEECVHSRVKQILLEQATVSQLVDTAVGLDDPREESHPAIIALFSRLAPRRRWDVASQILQLAKPSPGQLKFASRQLAQQRDGDQQAVAEDQQPVARADCDFLINSYMQQDRISAIECCLKSKDFHGLQRLAGDPFPAIRRRLARSLADVLLKRTEQSPFSDALAEILSRLQQDENPGVRADALTVDRATELLAAPERETSWRVLFRAAQTCRRPFSDIEPVSHYRPSKSEKTRADNVLSVKLSSGRSLEQPGRWLGSNLMPNSPAFPVSALGVSGHYMLPETGFARALDAGVNLFFWEPNYDTLTRFTSRIKTSTRSEMHFVAGTFAADAKGIHADAERALRMLKLDRIDLFMIFWVRSWNRISEDVVAVLKSLQEQGKIGMFSLSTHNRTLAMEAMQQGWNPMMVRHSAAHRGAEEELFSKGVQTETSLIAFNCTCYGRLLRPAGDSAGVTAADCLRYSLSQPGIKTCLTAPATLDQLEENLSILDDLNLSEDRRDALLEHGAVVYQHDKIFHDLVRRS